MAQIRLIGTDPSQVPTNGMLGNLAFQNAESVSLEKLAVTGNVGIGTLTPASRLEIVGNASSDAKVTFSRVPVQSSNDGVIGELFFQNNTDSIALISVKRQSAADDAYIQFATQQSGGGLTERLRITSTGTLNLVGAGTAGSTQAVSLSGTAPVNSLVLDSSGRVGIGNASPLTKLHINLTGSAVTPIVNVGSFGASGVVSLGGIVNNSEKVYLGTGEGVNGGVAAGIGFEREASGWNSALSFYTNNVTSGPNGVSAIQEKMRITSNGNVNIGVITSPQEKLNIVGNIRIEASPTEGPGFSNLNTVYNKIINISKYQNANHSSWFFVSCPTNNSSYSRGGNMRLRVNWTTGHASGIGYVEANISWRSNHNAPEGASSGTGVTVAEFSKIRSYVIGGSYYGWNANPNIRIYQGNNLTGGAAGFWIRAEGGMGDLVNNAGYDGYVVCHLYAELYSGDEHSKGIAWSSYSTSSGAPANVGSEITPVVLTYT